MPIDRIDHVQLAMPPGGEDLAVAFYEGLLGIRQVRKPPHLAVRGGCWFEDDDVKVHLGVDPDFRPARKAHPALLVTDLPALVGTSATQGSRFATTNHSPATSASTSMTRSATASS